MAVSDRGLNRSRSGYVWCCMTDRLILIVGSSRTSKHSAIHKTPFVKLVAPVKCRTR